MNNLPLETSVKSSIRVKYGLVKFFFVCATVSFSTDNPTGSGKNKSGTMSSFCVGFCFVVCLDFILLLLFYICFLYFTSLFEVFCACVVAFLASSSLNDWRQVQSRTASFSVSSELRMKYI